MAQQTVGFFMSWFTNPNAAGIALAIIFGSIWLFPYQPPLFTGRYWWLWVVILSGAIITMAAYSFLQIPVQVGIGQWLTSHFSQETLMRWLPLFGAPQILLGGLIQEGAKLVPVVIYRWRRKKDIIPTMGLVIGAVAGAGFGIFEAQWIHNALFASGQVVWVGLLERFFVVAFHIAASAIAGYGLVRGRGWQTYLLISLLHGLLYYSAVMVQIKVPVVLVEVFIALFAVVLTFGALLLRWQRPEIESDDIDSLLPES